MKKWVVQEFQNLGCSSTSTREQLHQAYRILALRYHPDHKGGSDKKFLDLKTGYDTILQNGLLLTHKQALSIIYRPNNTSQKSFVSSVQSIRRVSSGSPSLLAYLFCFILGAFLVIMGIIVFGV